MWAELINRAPDYILRWSSVLLRNQSCIKCLDCNKRELFGKGKTMFCMSTRGSFQTFSPEVRWFQLGNSIALANAPSSSVLDQKPFTPISTENAERRRARPPTLVCKATGKKANKQRSFWQQIPAGLLLNQLRREKKKNNFETVYDMKCQQMCVKELNKRTDFSPEQS